jgi:hypothetical protein
MSKTLDDYIKKLPPYIGKEIFKFIIQDSHNIIFYHKYNYDNYFKNSIRNIYDCFFHLLIFCLT